MNSTVTVLQPRLFPSFVGSSIERPDEYLCSETAIRQRHYSGRDGSLSAIAKAVKADEKKCFSILEDFEMRLANGAVVEPGPTCIVRKEKFVKGKRRVWIEVK